MKKSFRFNRDALNASLEKNASAQAYFSFLDTIEDILPVKSYIAGLKAGEYPVLTVAGVVALQYKQSNITAEQTKHFIAECALNPEQATSFFASLPKVLDCSCQWYKSNNRLFSVERDAIAYLTQFMDDEQLNTLATAADERNKEMTEKAEAETAKIERAKALFN